MDSTQLRICLVIFGFTLGRCVFPQVESIEPKIEGSDPLLGKDPFLSAPFTGLEEPHSYDIFPSTPTSILPPSFSSRRTDTASSHPAGETSKHAADGARWTHLNRKSDREERLRSLGTVLDYDDYKARLPSRREHSMRSSPQILSPSASWEESSLMGWNGLSPIAPGQSLIPVPVSTSRRTFINHGLTPMKMLSNQNLLESQSFSSIPSEETNDPDQITSSKLASQVKKGDKKASQKTGSKEKKTTMGSGGVNDLIIPLQSRGGGENTVSGRLRSQSLSSSGGALSSQSSSGATALRSSGLSGAAPRVPTLPSKRFHGGTPGEPRRPDYTYQYQGTRRYSVGETEYGTGSTYQSLPYYRRKR